jgi:hypothetical protein
MQSSRKLDKPSIRLPLACLVEHQGLLALVKSSFPQNAQIVDKSKICAAGAVGLSPIFSVLKQLELLTKIKMSAIIDNALLLDLTSEYKLANVPFCIYIDELTRFLPSHPKPIDEFIPKSVHFPEGEVVRPELIYKKFSKPIGSISE